eukprot:1737099-Rhodomonas_salina.1
MKEELHVEESGVTPTPAFVAPNPDGSPFNLDCFESELDAMCCYVLESALSCVRMGYYTALVVSVRWCEEMLGCARTHFYRPARCWSNTRC